MMFLKSNTEIREHRLFSPRKLIHAPAIRIARRLRERDRRVDGALLQLPHASSASERSLVRRSSLCENDEPGAFKSERSVTSLNRSDHLSRDALNPAFIIVFRCVISIELRDRIKPSDIFTRRDFSRSFSRPM